MVLLGMSSNLVNKFTGIFNPGLDFKRVIYCTRYTYCAANFSFAQLAKRKSLGRSKPATNSQAQALQHTVWNVSTISTPY